MHMLKKYTLTLIITFVLFASLNAKDKVIKGAVYDINTYEVIEQVNVYLSSNPIGTTTDEEGVFYFTVPEKMHADTVIFEHIAYKKMKIKVSEIRGTLEVYLTPGNLLSQKIIVEENRAKSDFAKDIPQSLTIIEAKDFEGRGYNDLGDLLRTKEGIQIDEELSGKKTISIRGGNAEDVIVFYNGIKMNSNYDNVFDLSLINLEDVQQIEIIRGSNTALYGSDAFSGIINIIPKTQQSYTARFSQKIGSYESGAWNLQLNKNLFKKFYLAYNQKRSGLKRAFSSGNSFLENQNTHHSASVMYDFAEANQKGEQNISIMYLRSDLAFENRKMASAVKDLNDLISFRFIGDIGALKQFRFSASQQRLDNNRNFQLENQVYNRFFKNKNWYLSAEQSIEYAPFKLTSTYQYEQGELDFLDNGTAAQGLESALLTRKKHGAAAVLKYSLPPNEGYSSTSNISVSYRFDHIVNAQRDVVNRRATGLTEAFPGLYLRNVWRTQNVKISGHVNGTVKDLDYLLYLNTGSNTKFPTMFHQIGTTAAFDINNPSVIARLEPEQNHSTELGLEITKQTPSVEKIDGLQFSMNYFINIYKNKFRSFFVSDFAQTVYENVPQAGIVGIENKISVFMLNRKVTFELGGSYYAIREKAAFPFKSEGKAVMNIIHNYLGYSTKINMFYEGDQIGWARTANGRYGEIYLEGFANVDFHISKEFHLYDFKTAFNLSLRNIIKNDTVVDGLAIRDRRIYLSASVSY